MTRATRRSRSCLSPLMVSCWLHQLGIVVSFLCGLRRFCKSKSNDVVCQVLVDVPYLPTHLAEALVVASMKPVVMSPERFIFPDDLATVLTDGSLTFHCSPPFRCCDSEHSPADNTSHHEPVPFVAEPCADNKSQQTHTEPLPTHRLFVFLDSKSLPRCSPALLQV